MSSKLKPCPFCGSHGRIWHIYGGYDVQCNICGNGTLAFEKLECAVESWNRRVSDEQGGLSQ